MIPNVPLGDHRVCTRFRRRHLPTRRIGSTTGDEEQTRAVSELRSTPAQPPVCQFRTYADQEDKTLVSRRDPSANILRCVPSTSGWVTNNSGSLFRAVSKMRGSEAAYLGGEHVTLRARQPDDVPILQAELYEDILTRSRADSRPWLPIPPDPALSPYAVAGVSDQVAFFSIITVAEHELAGEALLWGIDLHNRLAHLGLALLPSFRGRGWSIEGLQLLCRFGFAVRGLNRLQLETLSDNAAMICAAERVGFRREGVLRQAAWTPGSFADSVVMAMLAAEWRDEASA
jgi:RimJ/RimL family protein N-acetyltransferase